MIVHSVRGRTYCRGFAAENTDPGVRRTLEEWLKALYYDWLVTKLYRFRYVKAVEIAGRQRRQRNNKRYVGPASRAKRKISSLSQCYVFVTYWFQDYVLLAKRPIRCGSYRHQAG